MSFFMWKSSFNTWNDNKSQLIYQTNKNDPGSNRASDDHFTQIHEWWMGFPPSTKPYLIASHLWRNLLPLRSLTHSPTKTVKSNLQFPLFLISTFTVVLFRCFLNIFSSKNDVCGSVHIKWCYDSGKRQCFLLQENIYCACFSIAAYWIKSNHSPKYIPPNNLSFSQSLTHSHTEIFGISWGDTPLFVRVRQVTVGLVVWVIISS